MSSFGNSNSLWKGIGGLWKEIADQRKSHVSFPKAQNSDLFAIPETARYAIEKYQTNVLGGRPLPIDGSYALNYRKYPARLTWQPNIFIKTASTKREMKKSLRHGEHRGHTTITNLRC